MTLKAALEKNYDSSSVDAITEESIRKVYSGLNKNAIEKVRNFLEQKHMLLVFFCLHLH
jgi:hypothetical protein